MIVLEFMNMDVFNETYENMDESTAELLAAAEILAEAVDVTVHDDKFSFAGIVRARNQNDDTRGGDAIPHWCSAKISMSRNAKSTKHKSDFSVMIPVNSFDNDSDARESLAKFEAAKKDSQGSHIGRKSKIAIKNYIFDNQVAIIALWLCKSTNTAQKSFLEDYLSARSLKQYVIKGRMDPLTDAQLADKRKELIKAWKASDKYNGTKLNFGI